MLSDVHVNQLNQLNQLERLMTQGYDSLKQKQQQQALLCFNSVVLLAPKHTEALINCAEILLGLNRPAEATVYAQYALQLNSNVSNLTLYAKTLYQIGKYFEALGCFERIIADDPNNYTAIGQRALCLTQVNRYDEAFEAYQKALALSQEQDAWIHYNYSLCLLAMGNLPLGFARFEYRWLCTLRKKRRTWIVPESVSRDTLHGKSILIHSEQGLGDSIQFFRYVPLLVQFGARVHLEMHPALIPLFFAWRHSIRFIAIGSLLPSCDFHCPLMSVARLFKTEMHTIPRSIPYVFPNMQALETFRATIAHSGRKRVGIAWRGSITNSVNQQRSLALVALLSLHQTNLDFICLQKEVSLEEKEALEQHNIIYHGIELSTMAGTAAIIACLDLVVTVDTSIAHLAAAMGKVVWILLPFNADWRWFLQRDDSPWYPSVTLFRQETLGDWSSPLARIKKALATLSSVEGKLDVEHLIQEAHQQLQRGLWFEAGQRYRSILIHHPECHSAAQGIALAALQEHNMADAIQFMQLAAEIAPNQVVYRRNLGELLCRVGQFDAAIATHHIAISLEPDNAESHFLLALAYHNNGQFQLAIQHYRLALSFDQQYGLAWNNLGASLECMGEKHQAKSAYVCAVRINSEHAEAQNNLGAIYSEEGRIDEARTHFEAAIAARPDFIEAHYNLSLVKTYTHNDPHLAFLETVAEKTENYSIQGRIHYYFALGKALDDTQQFSRAFQAYAEGNRLHYRQMPWNKTILQNVVEQLPKVFTNSFLNQPKQSNEKRCPIFIVGMPRSGTTLIEQILCSHAQVYGAGELSILDDVIQEACHAAGLPLMTWVAQLTDQDFAALGEKYLEETWKLAPDKTFIVDKMPSNCFYIGMICRMLPTAKIIHAMRDPMDSCFSCFTHLFKTGMSFAYDLTALGEYYRLYAQTMQHWQNVLPPTRIFDLPYEQMVNHHETLTKQLLDYLGLPWDPNCLNFYNNHRIVKTASLTQVRKPIYKSSVKRWQHFAEQLQPLFVIIHPYVALFYSNLGEMHRRLNAIQLSIEYGQQAVTLAPNFATAWSNLGVAYYDAKHYAKAEDCHKRALAINPKLSSSLNNMGSIYKAYDKTQEAIAFYQAAIAISPQFIEPLNNLGALFLRQQEFRQAFKYLSQATQLAPNFSDAQCNLGLALIGLDQCENALIHFEKALQLKPDYPEVYYGIAKAHLNQHLFIESENAIRKAIAINPQQVEFYQLLAEIYQAKGDYRQALMHLDHTLQIDPTCVSSYLSKGSVLMEMGEIIKAEACFLKSAVDPNIDTQVLAHYSLVQLHKVKPDHSSLKNLLSLVNHPTQAAFTSKLEYAYFALGKCHDDMGEWAKAFAYFSLGCHVKRKRVTYDIAAQIEFTNKLIHCFTQQTIEYLRAFANPSALPIFIVGMPRSGTTLFEHALSSHSQVYGAGELKYFNYLIQQPVKMHQTIVYYPENVTQFSSEICAVIADQYLTYLQRFSPNAIRITDKMPHNFIAIGLIHALFPNAKIIHVERNPLDTCLSCYTKLFTEGQLYSYDLTELGQYYQCYERVMNHWRRILPSNAWLDVKYETMVNHFNEEVGRLLDFCALPWEDACLTFHQSKRQVRTASFAQVRQPVYTSSVERWRRYEAELAPLIKVLGESPMVSNRLPNNTHDQN